MRAIVVVGILAGVLPAFAWGPEGHRLISRIAETQLTPEARAQVAAILGPDKTLISIASWADEVRRSRPESANWHFVDIPINQQHLDMGRDCPKDDCVLGKISDLEKTVRDAAAPPEQRREALMFLVHFVADLHEPLHSSDNNDRGGNSVNVVFFDHQTNLHSTWDSGLLNRLPPEDELFPVLLKDAQRNMKKWRKGTVTDWAEQSHKSAQKIVYGQLPKGTNGQPLVLGAEYQQKADPLVKEQLAKAGVRLAAVLNQTLK
jgi:hypothetical protein